MRIAYGVAALVVLGGIGLFIFSKGRQPDAAPYVSNTATTSPIASTSPVLSQSPTVSSFPVNRLDRIESWQFTGAYSATPSLRDKAVADSAHLSTLLGTGTYDDYDLYIGIGNDADLVGDGQAAYRAYNRAATIHPAKGLAFANLGHLFDELGAYATAADAYAKAVAAEPGILEYHLDRLHFLADHFASDLPRMREALSDTAAQFGDAAPVLTIEAQWLEGQKRYAEAISAWKKVKELSPGQDSTAIDAAITRLTAKL